MIMIIIKTIWQSLLTIYFRNKINKYSSSNNNIRKILIIYYGPVINLYSFYSVNCLVPRVVFMYFCVLPTWLSDERKLYSLANK